MATEITYNRGSDYTFHVHCKTDNGAPLSLVGASVSVFEPHPLIADHVFATKEDAAGGIVKVRIEWSDEFATDVRLSFRIRIVFDDQGIDSGGSEIIYVRLT